MIVHHDVAGGEEEGDELRSEGIGWECRLRGAMCVRKGHGKRETKMECLRQRLMAQENSQEP